MWAESSDGRPTCLLCRCGAAALLTRDENVNTQREETQSTKIKLHLQPFASERASERAATSRRTDELKQTWWAEKGGLAGSRRELPASIAADWAVLKRDGQMEARRRRLLGMRHSSDRPDVPNTRHSDQIDFPSPSPSTPSHHSSPQGRWMSYIWAPSGDTMRGDVRKDRRQHTHHPVTLNPACQRDLKQRHTHIQSVCACDGGFGKQ